MPLSWAQPQACLPHPAKNRRHFYQDNDVYKEIAAKSIDIQDDIAIVLKELLGKSAEHLDRQSKENIFDSSRVY